MIKTWAELKAVVDKMSAEQLKDEVRSIEFNVEGEPVSAFDVMDIGVSDSGDDDPDMGLKSGQYFLVTQFRS